MNLFVRTVEVRGYIPLPDAALCLNCSVIYNLRDHRCCPACASGHGISLSVFLNREAPC